MDVIPVLGTGFNYYFPIVLLFVVLFTLFNVYDRCLDSVGISQFQFRDDWNDGSIIRGASHLKMEREAYEKARCSSAATSSSFHSISSINSASQRKYERLGGAEMREGVEEGAGVDDFMPADQSRPRTMSGNNRSWSGDPAGSDAEQATRVLREKARSGKRSTSFFGGHRDSEMELSDVTEDELRDDDDNNNGGVSAYYNDPPATSSSPSAVSTISDKFSSWWGGGGDKKKKKRTTWGKGGAKEYEALGGDDDDDDDLDWLNDVQELPSKPYANTSSDTKSSSSSSSSSSTKRDGQPAKSSAASDRFMSDELPPAQWQAMVRIGRYGDDIEK